MDCHRRQVHKTFITHIGFRLTLEEQAMYSYGERSHCKLWDEKKLFSLLRVNATRSRLGLHRSGGPQECAWGQILLLALAVLSLSPKSTWNLGPGFSLGLLFYTVPALRPSELRSSGASRWTRHILEIMVMPLQALCVFKHQTFSLHPCCVCVCVCVRELFFDICWEKWLIYSSWGEKTT